MVGSERSMRSISGVVVRRVSAEEGEGRISRRKESKTLPVFTSKVKLDIWRTIVLILLLLYLRLAIHRYRRWGNCRLGPVVWLVCAVLWLV